MKLFSQLEAPTKFHFETEKGRESVTLMPGTNEVPAHLVRPLSEHPMFVRCLERMDFRRIGDSTMSGKLPKVGEQIQIIKECASMDTLKLIREHDSRAQVQSEIESRIAVLMRVKDPDGPETSRVGE